MHFRQSPPPTHTHTNSHSPPEDWRYRHAALMAISAVGEGCEKQMFPILGEVVNAVLPYIQDQHHRVRYAACNALGQMANDFAPKLQNKFHDKVYTYYICAMFQFLLLIHVMKRRIHVH